MVPRVLEVVAVGKLGIAQGSAHTVNVREKPEHMTTMAVADRDMPGTEAAEGMVASARSRQAGTSFGHGGDRLIAAAAVAASAETTMSVEMTGSAPPSPSPAGPSHLPEQPRRRRPSVPPYP